MRSYFFPNLAFFVSLLVLSAVGAGLAPGCERSDDRDSAAADRSHQAESAGPSDGGANLDANERPGSDEHKERDEQGETTGGKARVDWPAPDALEANPSSLEGDLATIFRLISNGRTGAARVRLVKFDKINPDNGRSAFLFGLSYHEEQKYGKARPHYERAIRLESSYSTTYYFYGWCLYYLGELNSARRAFELHLSAQPDTADSHFAMGLINLDEAKLDAAEQRFKRAIELQQIENMSPAEIAERQPGVARNLSKAHTRLGDVYVRRQNLDQAREQYRRAVELFSGNYKTYYKLYRVLTRRGEDEAAQKALEQYNAIQDEIDSNQDKNQ